MLRIVPHGHEFAIEDTEGENHIKGNLVQCPGGGPYTRDTILAAQRLLKTLEEKAVTPKTQGHISLENFPKDFGLIFRWTGPQLSSRNPLSMTGDFRVVHGEDGRIWININGICFLRFKPE